MSNSNEHLDEDLFSFETANTHASDEFADALEDELDQALEQTEGDLDLGEEFGNPFDFDSLTDDDNPPSGAADSTDSTTASHAPETAAPETAAPQTMALTGSPRTQLVLAVMVAINLLLVGLSWRSQGSTRELIESLGTPAAQTQMDELAGIGQQPTTRVDPRVLPLAAPRAEGYETLEEAARSIERGEFQAAREMLFSLLSIIDRVEDTARYDVEARAAFLIGDTYRFEAEALDVATSAPADSAEGAQL